MALGQLRQDYRTIPQSRAVAPTSVDVGGVDAAPSPVLQLQQRLRNGVSAEPQVTKWPAYQSVALIVSASTALWMALLMSGAKAVAVVQPLIA